MKTTKKRSLMALVLTALLVVSGVPAVAFADADDPKPLEGKTISVMGDSISTYDGWSNKYPITDESCTNRYGEPYYGLPGSDCHNEELLVSDTWWYQAAEELGAEILVSNAGNSTGLFCASYPGDANWDLYLKEMLAWKSRGYHFGTTEKDPDIIALYIGTNEVCRAPISQMGSIDDVDFDTLIVNNGDGTFIYAEPATVAEAYCILLHKVTTTYPNAEIYCFACVPSAGGTLSTLNSRLPQANAFNEMVYGVAAYYGAPVVDLMDAYQLDPDGDNVATQEAFDSFAACYYNDPHPNAKGFDAITECFVDTVLANTSLTDSDSGDLDMLGNSAATVSVETQAGKVESVAVSVSPSVADGVTTLLATAEGYVTASGMIVDFEGTSKTSNNPNAMVSKEEQTSYTSVNEDGTYQAEGGSESITKQVAPCTSISISLSTVDDPETEADETKSYVQCPETGSSDPTGDDPKTSEDDGIYDYSTTSVIKQGGIETTTKNISFSSLSTFGSTENMTFITNQVTPNAENDLNMEMTPVVIPENPTISDGYDFVFIGSDKLSNFFPAFGYLHPVPGKANDLLTIKEGVTYYVGDGLQAFRNLWLAVDRAYLKDETVIAPEGSEGFIARWSSAQQFILTDANGQSVSTYCCDQITNTIEGFSYNIENLFDANYYDESDANMIRAIAYNGYWGTASGFGSLNYVKQALTDSGEFTQDEIDRLTDGMALTATQLAIWSYSNRSDSIYLNVYHSIYKNFYHNKKKGDYGPAELSDADLLFKFYRYLITLDPLTLTEVTTKDTVINEKNFLEDVTVELVDKPADNPYNLDENADNDVYTANVTFTLEVTPESSDDLVASVLVDGEPAATGRLTGTLEEGESWATKNSDSCFTLTNVPLQEGEEVLCLHLEGEQVLNHGVYLFTSEVINSESSQTMVGVASGPRNVDVAMALTFELDVEDDVVKEEHVWRTEDVTEPKPSEDPKDNPKDDPKDNPVIAPTGDNLTGLITFAIFAAMISAAAMFRMRKSAR